jgi:hypothetical protein
MATGFASLALRPWLCATGFALLALRYSVARPLVVRPDPYSAGIPFAIPLFEASNTNQLRLWMEVI